MQDESSLDAIADRVLSTARMYEGIIALGEAFSTSRYLQLYFDELSYRSAYLTIRLDYLKCNPEKDRTESVALYLLSWVGKVNHLYACVLVRKVFISINLTVPRTCGYTVSYNP